MEQKHIKKYDSDLTQILLTLELIRSFKVHWKSKEIVLRLDNRKDMLKITSLLDMFFSIEEDILEEESKKETNPEEA